MCIRDSPELLVDRPIERTVVFPDNPYVMGPHLAAAAQEHPLTEADAQFFGPGMPALADTLASQGVLRRRPAGWFWPHANRAVDSIDLRSMQGKACDIVEAATGRVIGQVDAAAADRTLHPDAIYVHQGEQWLIPVSYTHLDVYKRQSGAMESSTFARRPSSDSTYVP